MTSSFQKLLAGSVTAPIRRNVSLADATTYKIGGPAELFLQTGDEKDIIAAVRACIRHEIPLTVLGAGSNVLAPDRGIEGLVLRVYDDGLMPFMRDETIACSAGVTDKNLAEFACKNAIGGYEFLFDIPGTVGGAIVQNAGTNDGQIADRLIDVRYIDRAGEIVTMSVEQLNMGYRHSVFKDEGGAILFARFKKGPEEKPEAIRAKMEEIRKTRWSKFPMECPNCGSVFKRPPGDYAGRLIQEAGLGGFRIGGAMVSPLHRGFIVNTGSATEKDVKAVAAHVRDTVMDKFGVKLERELIYLPEKPGVIARVKNNNP